MASILLHLILLSLWPFAPNEGHMRGPMSWTKNTPNQFAEEHQAESTIPVPIKFLALRRARPSIFNRRQSIGMIE